MQLQLPNLNAKLSTTAQYENINGKALLSLVATLGVASVCYFLKPAVPSGLLWAGASGSLLHAFSTTTKIKKSYSLYRFTEQMKSDSDHEQVSAIFSPLDEMEAQQASFVLQSQEPALVGAGSQENGQNSKRPAQFEI